MFSYQKLKNVEEREEADEELVIARKKIISYCVQRKRWGRGRWSWRRPRVRVAGLLRRAVRGKAAAVRAAMGTSLKKVMIRLKEGRPYVSELFAGNYLFMQVNPSVAMPYLDKSLVPATRLHQAYAITPRIAY
ncbi:uncharacterized protein LOC110034852 [Phalaenopsis equestris]|uniref:uncharacterized protein LOC110034852 n=1 Tax=Phalaenopsis equestris TaxID=78828 RepID=UPI0009E4528C|nr:uncharacterized protein LOC110034852 [Phalaenopsis equestris]